MQNKVNQVNVENEFLLISKLFPFPTATVVVAHSPTPSAVKTTASLKGDGKKHLQRDSSDDLKNKYYGQI